MAKTKLQFHILYSEGRGFFPFLHVGHLPNPFWPSFGNEFCGDRTISVMYWVHDEITLLYVTDQTTIGL